jgi:O-methyltransferase involved in polyketide biosynthesis
MKGNENIALTAEPIALIRSEQNSDKFSRYFVSPKIKRKYKFLKILAPKNAIKKIFERRVELSNSISSIIKKYKPEQIVELASGYSTRGIIFKLKNNKIIYIESDFSSIIKRKKEVIKEIVKKEGLNDLNNLILEPIDVLKDDIYEKVRGYLKKGKKTIIVAETLNSYFNYEQHEVLISNVKRFLDKMGGGIYISHEVTPNSRGKMLSGLLGSFFKKYLHKIIKNKTYYHFKNESELKKYFLEKGFQILKISKSSTGNYIYVLKR